MSGKVGVTVTAETASEAGQAPDSRRWWAMSVISLGVSLIIMDATVVNVAMPTVIRSLSLDPSQAEWLNAVYALTFAALLLLFGRVGDLIGRRYMIAGGLAVFTLASAGAGAAGDGSLLVTARLVQGVGASMILPAALSTVNAMFTGRSRAAAFAIWGSTIGGMAAVGPVVGGWLVTDLSWRWAFWLNIPVAAVALAGTLALVPETRDRHARRRLDIGGAVLACLAFAGIVFALIEGQRYGWWRQGSGALSPVPVAMAAGVVLLADFGVLQRRRALAGRAVLADLSLLRIRSFRYGLVAALVVAFGEFGLLFTLPLLLQGALGYSALGTGVLVLALAMGTFLISGMTPQLARRLTARGVVRAGLATEAVAVAGLGLTLAASTPGWALAGWLFLYGAGVGMATAQLTNVILADVPVRASGEASGIQSTVRQLGSAVGVAVLGSLLVVSLAHGTATRLAAHGITGPASASAVSQVRASIGAVIPALRAAGATRAAGQAAAAALVHASQTVTLVAAAIIAVGLAVTYALPAGGPGPDRQPGDSGPRGTRRRTRQPRVRRGPVPPPAQQRAGTETP